jgi:zinc/manganese transport system permease protein
MFGGFMTNAWVVGTVVALLAGATGFFVVMRGAAFAAHAIPNGAFAGAAAATLVGASPLVGLIGFSLLAALGIGVSRQRSSDVSTAVTLTGMLALGAAFLAVAAVYEPQIDALLFGEILGVSTSQFVPVGLIAVVAGLALVAMYRPLLFQAVAPDLAAARGLRAGVLEVGFMVTLALAAALTVPVVGALLSFSLTVGPPAAARLLTSRPGRALAWSMGLSTLTLWFSLAAAYQSNWPVGFFVGSFSAALYVVVRWARRAHHPAA